MKLPHIICLCGHPNSGKSEVQKIITDLGAMPVDDGRPLRKFCVDWLGMSWEDVTTQAGKTGFVEINGKKWQIREILGVLGNKLEEMFGMDGIPFMATRNLNSADSYCFGSVRREQGSFYKNLNGVILGVRRPGVLPSPYEFDRFDESLIDMWIDNDGDLEELRETVMIVLSMLPLLQQQIRWSAWES